MSDIETTPGPLGSSEPTGTSRKEQAKQVIGQAGQALKTEAQSFAQTAQERARAEAQKRTQAATDTLHTFAGAIRAAGDELGQADQSPAARLVRQAADGLENFASNLAGKQPEDLLNDVRDFGRKNPVAFIGGALLVGVALGRFVRASETASSTARYYGEGGPDYVADTAQAIPLTSTEAFPASAEATSDVSTGLTAEEDAFDGRPEFSGADARVGIESAAGDDLTPSDADSSTTVTTPGAGGTTQRQGF